MWQAMHNSSMLFTLYANRRISSSVLADSTGCLWWQSTPAVMNPSRLHRSHSPPARCHTIRFTSAQRGEFNSFWYLWSLLMSLCFHIFPVPRYYQPTDLWCDIAVACPLHQACMGLDTHSSYVYHSTPKGRHGRLSRYASVFSASRFSSSVGSCFGSCLCGNR